MPVSQEVADWFARIAVALADGQVLLLADSLDRQDQKALMDELGGAFSEYRELVYSNGFSGKTSIQLGQVVDFCRSALCFVDHAHRGQSASGRACSTPINQLVVADDGSSFEVVNLPEMLEGQVAVLSSGFLAPAEAIELLRQALRERTLSAKPAQFSVVPGARAAWIP